MNGKGKVQALPGLAQRYGVPLTVPDGRGGILVGGRGPEPLDWGWTRSPERDPTPLRQDMTGGCFYYYQHYAVSAKDLGKPARAFLLQSPIPDPTQ